MSEDGWEVRMAERARQRATLDQRRLAHDQVTQATDSRNWPVPDRLKGYSGRDCFLWYVCDGYRRIFGRDLEVVFDHDFGHHILSDGIWQVEFTNLSQFPNDEAPPAAARF